MSDTLSEADAKSVKSVLSHWFGGDQQINYKTKWFPEGSTGLQSIADNEVNTKFGFLFGEALARKLHHWQCDTKASVALIIVLDQFSRHICRLHGKELMPDKQKLADELALEIAQRLHSDEEKTLGLSIPEYVFSLMPLRHTATVDHLSHVLECLQKKERVEEKSMELLNRFRKQTTRRLQHLQDREKLEATADILEREAFVADETDIMNHPLVQTTEAFLIKHLQLSPVAGDKGTASVKGGKGKKGGEKKGQQKDRKVNGEKGEGSEVVKEDKVAADSTEPNFVLFISLSGGVDSMVISKILRLLQVHRPQLRIKYIQAMHIDYGNRPESAEEAAFVMHWSLGDTNDSAMLGGLQCQVRRVNEVTRGVTNRDEYEKVARDIRYNFYKQCMAEAAANNNKSSSSARLDSDSANSKVVLSGVIFGHHEGDVQENVISNVMRGSGPLQLSGMNEVSVTNGVPVWRPLLSHNKDEIYDFAHKYGVPYFKDSTPSWSTRGKLRSQLVPLLLDMYGSGCLHNLTNLARESDLTRDLVQANLYEPFLSSVKRHPCGLSVNVLAYRQQPQCFWREALRQLMHSMNMPMVRDSAVGNFVERLQKEKNQKQQQKQLAHAGDSSYGGMSLLLLGGWLELRKGVHSFLTEGGDLIILREGVLRKQLTQCVSSTTNNQKKQQMLSQAKKLPFLTAISAALSDTERVSATVRETYASLVQVELDVSTGTLRVDTDKLAVLNQREYGIATSSSDVAANTNTNTTNSTSDNSASDVLVVGPWHIQVQVLYRHVEDKTDLTSSTPLSTMGCKALSSLAAILPGSLTYDLPLTSTLSSTMPDPARAINISSISNTCDNNKTGKVQLSLYFQVEQLRSQSEELTLYSDLCDQLQRGLSISTSDTTTSYNISPSVTSATPTTSSASTAAALPSAEEVQVLCSEVVLPADLSLVLDRLRYGLPLLVLRNRSTGGTSSNIAVGNASSGMVEVQERVKSTDGTDSVPYAVRFVYTYH